MICSETALRQAAKLLRAPFNPPARRVFRVTSPVPELALRHNPNPSFIRQRIGSQRLFSTRSCHCSIASTNTMSSSSKDVRDVINSDLLASVRSFWFSHIPDQDAAVLPGREHMKPWFFGDEQFDSSCVYIPLIYLAGHRDTGLTSMLRHQQTLRRSHRGHPLPRSLNRHRPRGTRRRLPE